MSRRKTTKEFKQEIKNLVGNEYTLASEYKNAITKVNIIHNKCGYKDWWVTPHNFLSGKRCPKCSGNLKYDTKSFAKLVKDKTNNTWYLDKDSSYKTTNTKVCLVHRVCGIKKWTTPKNFKQNGVKCKHCRDKSKQKKNHHKGLSEKKKRQLQELAKSKRKSPEQFRKEFYQKVGNEYTLLSDYAGSDKKIHVLHNICGNDYWVRQDKFMNEGQRCNECQHHRSRESYVKLLDKVSGGIYTLLDPTYSGSKSIVNIHCSRCNRDFTQRADMMLTGYGCPFCNQSKGERLVLNTLNSLGYKENIDFRYGFVLPNRLHLDFWIPSIRIAIEYDGEQHYRAVNYFGGAKVFKKQQIRDQIKNKYCKEHNIKLIRIPYTVINEYEVKKILSPYINQ